MVCSFATITQMVCDHNQCGNVNIAEMVCMVFCRYDPPHCDDPKNNFFRLSDQHFFPPSIEINIFQTVSVEKYFSSKVDFLSPTACWAKRIAGTAFRQRAGDGSMSECDIYSSVFVFLLSCYSHGAWGGPETKKTYHTSVLPFRNRLNEPVWICKI